MIRRAALSILLAMAPTMAVAQPLPDGATQAAPVRQQRATPAALPIAPDRRARDEVTQIFFGTAADRAAADMIDQALPQLPTSAMAVDQLSITWANRLTAMNDAADRNRCNAQITDDQTGQRCATIPGTGRSELVQRPGEATAGPTAVTALQPILDVSVDRAATGLANDNTNAEDRTNQALATVAFGNLNPPPPADKPKDPTTDPTNSEAVQAVLGILGAPKP